jgi:uncharacterized protein YkwD
MKLFLIFFLFLFTTSISFSQQINDKDNLARSWPLEQLRAASVSSDIMFMSTKEKDVVLLFNLARMNGPFFVKTILNPYMESKNMKSNRYVKSLIRTLNQQNPLPVLQADKLLYQLALSHAKESGEKGTTGHDGFDDRFKKANKVFWRMAENCYYGHNEALEIAVELLIDNGITDLGHRNNILNHDLGFIGVSIQPHHSVYEYNCVMDFGGKR